MGISSECWLVYLAAMGPAKNYTLVQPALFAILLIYIPGMFSLELHLSESWNGMLTIGQARISCSLI